MIIARAPLRISLGGGGTDLPSYYRHFGSTFVSAAIDRHVYAAVCPALGPEYVVRHAVVERSVDLAGLGHGLVREALRVAGPGRPVEVSSFADLPAGTGLGSSGAFTVALLAALHSASGRDIEPGALAEEASAIEIERLREPVGKQDPTVAAHGGLARYDIDPRGRVTVTPIPVPDGLDGRLRLFFTGQVRSASAVLRDQDARASDEDVVANLHQTRALGAASADALLRGDLAALAEGMNEQWEQKRRRSALTTSSAIAEARAIGLNNGALGGKLVGAGGGGFLLFLAEDTARLSRAMAAAGLPEVLVSIAARGVELVRS